MEPHHYQILGAAIVALALVIFAAVIITRATDQIPDNPADLITTTTTR